MQLTCVFNSLSHACVRFANVNFSFALFFLFLFAHGESFFSGQCVGLLLKDTIWLQACTVEGEENVTRPAASET